MRATDRHTCTRAPGDRTLRQRESSRLTSSGEVKSSKSSNIFSTNSSVNRIWKESTRQAFILFFKYMVFFANCQAMDLLPATRRHEPTVVCSRSRRRGSRPVLTVTAPPCPPAPPPTGLHPQRNKGREGGATGDDGGQGGDTWRDSSAGPRTVEMGGKIPFWAVQASCMSQCAGGETKAEGQRRAVASILLAQPGHVFPLSLTR